MVGRSGSVAKQLPKRPRVSFEERFVNLRSRSSSKPRGIDIFADRSSHGAAKDRVVKIDEVVERKPDLIIGSWCGKKFRPERVTARPGFAQIPAVQ
jgi:iron complex transport system substrate-binding protein